MPFFKRPRHFLLFLVSTLCLFAVLEVYASPLGALDEGSSVMRRAPVKEEDQEYFPSASAKKAEKQSQKEPSTLFADILTGLLKISTAKPTQTPIGPTGQTVDFPVFEITAVEESGHLAEYHGKHNDIQLILVDPPLRPGQKKEDWEKKGLAEIKRSQQAGLFVAAGMFTANSAGQHPSHYFPRGLHMVIVEKKK
ncbi:hypothetical protein BT96DRAFT_997321 [Gymnopus androsaceus JB14]|uniref:Uncharacterized protein n=1 Tax=Gymnopus androsaceus JB14 TaxID=1447944 RepID=A0A6A4HCZ4_9AGAR|nr:hypothetical protein BT96DRAFT_997321 [Gymnopus androsaceus JB14]